MRYAVAVLDIGKTNKKLALFDDRARLLAVEKCHIDTIRHEELEIEDVAQIERWFLAELARAARRYPIVAISISAHGATVVCVGEDGLPCVPPVAYTNEVPEAFHDRFYAHCGDRDELQQRTATAEIKPLINVAKLLYFTSQRFPEAFARTRQVLLYPQYFAFRLTGVAAAEITYVGCHTYLWDPHRAAWSDVTDRLGIRHLLPKRVGKPTDILGPVSARVADATGLAPQTIVTSGIHDSNSSLMPYLISQRSDFVLNSTGSWCVAMHRVKRIAFHPAELGKMVFYNASYAGDPIKTSLLVGGMEFETYTAILSRLHGRTDLPGFDPELCRELTAAADTFVLPSVVFGAGQFPMSRPRVVAAGTVYPLAAIQDGSAVPPIFADYERGIALVDLSVAVQSRVALQRVGLDPGVRVFIEGGFRNNACYLRVLAALLPDNPVVVTSFEEATATGAALCAIAARENRPVETFGRMVSIEQKPVEPAHLPAVESYADALLALIDA